MPAGEDDPSEPDEGTVLSPEELDITDDESVEEIEEGRFVISPGEGGDAPSVDVDDGDADADHSGEATAAGFDEESVHRWLEEEVEAVNATYGFDVTAKFEGTVHQQQLFSNDVATTFANLVTWYAQHAGHGTPLEEAIGILLVESNVPVRYPPETLRELVASYGLDADDSIRDLLEAVGDDEVAFPP